MRMTGSLAGAHLHANTSISYMHIATSRLHFFLSHAEQPYELRADRCTGSAPTQPNGWTNGSWTFPDSGFFSTASFGVWRPCPIFPPSEAELTISKVIDMPTCLSSGIGLARILAGRFGSSTRAEIAGGILHLLAPGPAHIGTDSQAFLSKAKQVLDYPCRTSA